MQALLLCWLIALCLGGLWAAAVWAREMLQDGARRSVVTRIKEQRDDFEALLPWHAAGTLSRRDAERMNKVIASDPELARSSNLVCEELNATIALNESLGVPSARSLEKLFAAIDAEPRRKPKASFDLVGRLAIFISRFSPRTVAWAASAGVLAIVMQAGMIATSMVKDGSRRGTELASVGVTDTSLAVIRFAPKAEAVGITKFLEIHNVSVVDGPKSSGMFTIRLPETGRAKDDLLKQMEAQSAIVEFIATVH
jgi:hypothetical protein